MSNSAIKAEDGVHSTTGSSNQSGSNDFVKKLFQMLNEDSYKDIVRWTTNGDSFVVLNTNEFTKEILPRHFKHSNFASFVRQLNKYDFHKVKIPNEEKQNYQYGEDAWEFKHPDFRMNDHESLENIKRKGPSAKKGLNSNDGSGGMLSYTTAQMHHMKESIELLKTENKQLHSDMNILQNKYKTLIDKIVTINNVNERSYRSMNILVNSLVHAGIKVPPLDFPSPTPLNISSTVSQATGSGTVGMGTGSSGSSAAANQQPHAHTHSHSGSLGSISPPGNRSLSGTTFEQPYLGQPLQPPMPMHSRAQSGDMNAKPRSPQMTHPTNSESPVVNASSYRGDPRRSSNEVSSDIITTTSVANPKFHVLLVEDDNVCIQLCRKFLVKYGCQVTVVTDGLNAISTVEHTKYDLVLMDIVMPNLDGATATSVIRSFDTRTPIIAMTGNIEDNDLVTYLQNGMSDILAKPFTKDDLYSILSKHLLAASQKNDVSPLQGPPQETLTLPQDHDRQLSSVQQDMDQGSNDDEQLLKKQRLQ